MSGLGFVSVDELATEIEKHHDSDLLRCQIADLRAKKIDLKKFCSNVRMMCGAQVLLDTVKGLQAKQKTKQATKAPPSNGAGTSSPPQPVVVSPVGRVETKLPLPVQSTIAPKLQPAAESYLPKASPTLPSRELLLPRGQSSAEASSATTQEAPPNPAAFDKHSGLQEGSKTLVHALLCSRESCEISGCKTTKVLLARVKEHASSCSFANLPGGQGDCTTCRKWQQLERLKEHYRRKLIVIAKQQVAQGKLSMSQLRPSAREEMGDRSSTQVKSEPASDRAPPDDPVRSGAAAAMLATQGQARRSTVMAKGEAHLPTPVIAIQPPSRHGAADARQPINPLAVQKPLFDFSATPSYLNGSAEPPSLSKPPAVSPLPLNVPIHFPPLMATRELKSLDSFVPTSIPLPDLTPNLMQREAEPRLMHIQPEPRMMQMPPEPRLIHLPPEPRLMSLDVEPRVMQREPDRRIIQMEPEPGVMQKAEPTYEAELPPIDRMYSNLDSKLAPFWETLEQRGATDEMDSLDALLNEEFEKRDQRLGINKRKEVFDEALPKKVARGTTPPLLGPNMADPFNSSGMSTWGMGKPVASMHGKGPVTAGQSKPFPPSMVSVTTPAPIVGKYPKGKQKEPQPLSPAGSTLSHESMGSVLDVDHLAEVAHENQYMQIIDEGADMKLPSFECVHDDALSQGMHVAIDLQRDPDTTVTIPTSSRPNPTNVGMVTTAYPDGTCDVQLVCNCEPVRSEGEVCSECEAGAKVSGVRHHQRQIVCSTCLVVDLPFALPQLRCSNCEKQVKNGSNYFNDRDLTRRIKLCAGCFSDFTAGDPLPALAEFTDDLTPTSFEKLVWQAKEQEDYDYYVQCEGDCRRWYHYICASYPDPSQLQTRDKTLEAQQFVCEHCRKHYPPLPNDKVLKLQQRKARELPRCYLSDAIERYLENDLRRNGKWVQNLVVRLVSNKKYTYHVMGEMKARYGDDYPDSFPYRSKLLFAFQTIQGRDVLCFAMYVQEYGSQCPQPNTNRTYISYLDSVAYMETSPPGERTAVYHGIINGYLKYACSQGFEHAHIWVAPPQSGDEYIFHCRPLHPKHGQKAMSMQKLRSWYEALLLKAKEAGIVTEIYNIHEAVEHLTSVREFPLFYGDFFPEEMRKVLQGEYRDEPVQSAKPSGKTPPQLVRHSSMMLVKQMQKRARDVRRRFLVAHLNKEGVVPEPALQDENDACMTNDLVDSRLSFLQKCIDRHWQFNELRRAHYSTMMLLAEIGGPA